MARARIVSLGLACAALLAGACSLEPIDIGRTPPVDPVPGELTSGSLRAEWDAAQLEAGVVELVQLGALFEAVFDTAASDSPARRVAIELWPIEPAQLPADVVAVVYTAADTPAPAFVDTPVGLRFEAELELGWRLELRADQFVILQLTAQFID